MNAAPTWTAFTVPDGTTCRPMAVTMLNASRVAALTTTPTRPHLYSRAVANTMTAPTIVTVMDSSNPMCGGDAITASKPYRPCHHWSHSP
ncbi:hypothetical protein ACFQ1S_46760 [Kibdelosporangium lantanae]|uniref:Uncharacterized protein n=1 Tax=Kibdelosporangium lantanae TaxID=1497396 RepID=A0ABW3MR87_9PSEU